MLTARALRVSLGGTPVLNGIDLDARPGALTAIVGPNGSGKTTLLRALTGEIAFAGTARLGPLDVGSAPAWALAEIRAVLPQASALAFPFTALEVVGLGCARPDPQIAAQALAQVGLAGFGGRFYQELSGGEKQRVQLARALAQVGAPTGPGAPRWLFLDEPVSSLDIGHQLQVMTLARAFAAAGGGVVAVMHDLNLTAMFADHVVLLKDGAVLGAGPPASVLTDALLSRAYDCPLRVGATPPAGLFVLPQSAAPLAVQAAG